MPKALPIPTTEKALAINLDNGRYGTFAEIGAGQEVVRWFFQVGGAAGTVAKSISAYDMTMSDTIYGKADRYVSRPRLESMLNYEQNLNIERLTERASSTAFFSFANTVSARNYLGTNSCHGWMGMKFQANPGDESSQIVIHVRMLDPTNAMQQEALGIVGVNLIYGACVNHNDPDDIMESLLDGLSIQRIEIDMIEFSGPCFSEIDNRLMSLKLVEMGLSNAAMFGPDGRVIQPSNVLRKRPLLVERGSFRPFSNAHRDLLRAAHENFCAEPDVEEGEILQIAELTMSKLMEEGAIDYKDFLARADMLLACGMTVLISNYFEYYRLAQYLRLHTDNKIAITIGMAGLKMVLNEKYYEHLAGGILEAFGRLFKHDLAFHVYPSMDRDTREICTVHNLKLGDEIRHLYRHLLERGYIKPLDNYDEDSIDVYSREVLKMIKNQDSKWENMVPSEVRDVIKENGYMGYTG
ncbi:MAG: TonB-dependent receptor [Verrucomicrobiales bacterium]|nr:TonB-dependent receptor [Verrucomicrobiales bacterium]